MWREIMIWVGAFAFIALAQWIFRPIDRAMEKKFNLSRFWRIALTVAVLLVWWWMWYR